MYTHSRQLHPLSYT